MKIRDGNWFEGISAARPKTMTRRKDDLNRWMVNGKRHPVDFV